MRTLTIFAVLFSLCNATWMTLDLYASRFGLILTLSVFFGLTLGSSLLILQVKNRIIEKWSKEIEKWEQKKN